MLTHTQTHEAQCNAIALFRKSVMEMTDCEWVKDAMNGFWYVSQSHDIHTHTHTHLRGTLAPDICLLCITYYYCYDYVGSVTGCKHICGCVRMRWQEIVLPCSSTKQSTMKVHVISLTQIENEIQLNISNKWRLVCVCVSTFYIEQHNAVCGCSCSRKYIKTAAAAKSITIRSIPIIDFILPLQFEFI